MSRAYELFYANHSLESKMESCALCFQAADASRKSKKKTARLLLPFVSSDSFFLLCIFCYCKPSTPCFSLCVCGPVDGRAQLSRPNNWRNSLRYLEFKMTSAHCCVLHQKYSEQRKFLHVLEKRVTVRTNSRSWAECNDSASFFFCFFSCSTAHGVTGD